MMDAPAPHTRPRSHSFRKTYQNPVGLPWKRSGTERTGCAEGGRDKRSEFFARRDRRHPVECGMCGPEFNSVELCMEPPPSARLRVRIVISVSSCDCLLGQRLAIVASAAGIRSVPYPNVPLSKGPCSVPARGRKRRDLIASTVRNLESRFQRSHDAGFDESSATSGKPCHGLGHRSCRWRLSCHRELSGPDGWL